MNSPPTDWHDTNYESLETVLDSIRILLVQRVTLLQNLFEELAKPDSSDDSAPLLYEPATGLEFPPLLNRLRVRFGLSRFECELVLLCAGAEIDAEIGAACAAVVNDQRAVFPTLELARVLFGVDRRDALLLPVSPARYWGMIELGTTERHAGRQVRLDERMLHYLLGRSYVDERLQSLVRPLSDHRTLSRTQDEVVERIVRIWSNEVGAPFVIIQLCSVDRALRRSIGARACERLGLQPYMMYASDIPAAPNDREQLARLWEREAVLSDCALMLECDDIDAGHFIRTVGPFIENLQSPVLLVAQDPLPVHHRPTVRLNVGKPTPAEQRELWKSTLGDDFPLLESQVDQVVSHFNLGTNAIHATVTGMRERSTSGEAAEALWDICRIQARTSLEDLASRIQPAATWDDLVVPGPQQQTLQEIVAHVKQRAKVYERWGFASKGSRGLGISALFSGPSGTGKTTAAEVIAHELRLDLYHIDLSRVVSKYIGETEKNLARIFDAAEEGGAILLFDEADALFGKRSEVKDSHDRHANVEVSYLLQRMEAYRGLAILTTNMKYALDPAFLRRIRFVVEFDYPAQQQRMEIWRRIFPAKTPIDGLDYEKLARLNVAGGNIRNIALNAAFLAADEGAPVGMEHILRATRTEYVKLEKPLTDAEIKDWR